MFADLSLAIFGMTALVSASLMTVPARTEAATDSASSVLRSSVMTSGCTGLPPGVPVVGMAATPGGGGYWLVDSAGQVAACGDAPELGSLSFTPSHPVVGISSTPDGNGFWLVAADGGVFSFGDAAFYGSMGAVPLNEPVVGMAATADGAGYWLVAADGGVFSFDAPFDGSMGGTRLNQPVVGMSAAGGGTGYRLVASDGGIFDFGAPFDGSMGGVALNGRVVGMAAESGSGGYWLVAADGGIFAFDAPFDGSTAGPGLPLSTAPVTPDGTPYLYDRSDSESVVVTAPGTTGSNEREFFWDAGSPDEADSTVCATFLSGQGFDQQGLVLRLNDVGGVVTGITITRNIFLDDFQVFNFHLWNTSDATQPFVQFGSTTLPFLPIRPAVYPLNMCARTVTPADQVQFIVWTANQSEPAWGDPNQGGEATMPSDAPASGLGGFYAGHLSPGTDMVDASMTVNGQPF